MMSKKSLSLSMVAVLVLCTVLFTCLMKKDACATSFLSEKQHQLVTRLGYPDSFLMILSRDDPDNLERRVKYESWRYYDMFAVFYFIDGHFVGTDDIENLPEGSILPDYSPGLFEEGMNPGDVFLLFEELFFARVEVMPELLKEAELYCSEQIIVGFQNDELIYVESVPLVPAPVGE